MYIGLLVHSVRHPAPVRPKYTTTSRISQPSLQKPLSPTARFPVLMTLWRTPTWQKPILPPISQSPYRRQLIGQLPTTNTSLYNYLLQYSYTQVAPSLKTRGAVQLGQSDAKKGMTLGKKLPAALAAWARRRGYMARSFMLSWYGGCIGDPTNSEYAQHSLAAMAQLQDSCWQVSGLWTPAHCGIPGNERADMLAKQGAQTSRFFWHTRVTRS